MNYFELFDLPLSFVLDDTVVKNRYDELIDKYRPDLSAGTGDVKHRALHERLLLIEEAYHVFQNGDETISYVLKLKNYMPDDHYVFPTQFMMEVRDIDEELVELELDEKQEQLMEVEQKVSTLLIKLYDETSPILASYKEDSDSEEALLQVKDFYHEKKYLQRILDRIRLMRNIASL